MAKKAKAKTVATEAQSEGELKLKTSVKSYQEGAEQYRGELERDIQRFDRDVKAKIRGIKDQMKMNQAAASRMDSSVRGFKNDIKEQTKENQAAALHIQDGVTELLDNIQGLVRQINTVQRSYVSYAKAFWG